MIDFFGSSDHYAAHLMPVFQAMPSDFPSNMTGSFGLLQSGRENPDPIVLSSWQDAEQCQRLGRPLVLMEHGAGQTYAGCVLPNYLNGEGRQILSGIMVVNPDHVRQSRAVAPNIPVEPVGCPRLATLAQIPLRGLDILGQKTLVLAFRWDTEMFYSGSKKAIPEARSAWLHWASLLPAMIQAMDPAWKVILHFHPRVSEDWKNLAASIVALNPDRVEYSEDQAYCLGRATIWAQDNSSALWEACAVGVPVVHLNAPWYRKKAQHGLRFWTWTRTGPEANTPTQLLQGIDSLMDAKTGAEYARAREEFAAQWYGFDPNDPGLAAIRAAEVLCQWFPVVQGQAPPAAPDRAPVAQESKILMRSILPYQLLAEGEFWSGDEFYAGWKHARRDGQLVPVQRLGHLDPRARSRELEQTRVALRAG